MYIYNMPNHSFHELLQTKFEVISLMTFFDSNRGFFNNQQIEYLGLILGFNLAKIDKLINEKIVTDGYLYTTLTGEHLPET